ncbi:MAG: aspartate/glutamate racemase family protein [Desulfobulbaceae bacterium]|nr:aspartate/glutamate racemase family protein [Desulfobulbaceae bacterium]
MKIIGIIGGIGPESTGDYYKAIISAFNSRYAELAYPEIIVYSVNLNELLRFVEAKRWPALADWLLEKIFALHRAGAQFAAVASNTPHIVFEEIKAKSPVPLVSIVEATCLKAQEMGLKILGCTELPLILTESQYDTPFLNTSEIHCESIISYCISNG